MAGPLGKLAIDVPTQRTLLAMCHDGLQMERALAIHTRAFGLRSDCSAGCRPRDSRRAAGGGGQDQRGAAGGAGGAATQSTEPTAADSHERIVVPRLIDAQPGWPAGHIPLSGCITDVTAWHEGWVGEIESCVTEIGLSLESRPWIAVDADYAVIDVPCGRRRTRAFMAAQPATGARGAHRCRTRGDLGLRVGPFGAVRRVTLVSPGHISAGRRLP
jgi:hypothetical protein